jgi:hypothetical protein
MRSVNERRLGGRSVRTNGANGIDTHVGINISYQPGKDSKSFDAK